MSYYKNLYYSCINQVKQHIEAIMNKEQVLQTIELLKEGHSLTDVTKIAKINVMYVSVIRKLMVMNLINIEG
ncbi:hypothetical protein PE36_13037 [Moritella sp. PE36]|nr:hypothetical protein PE36_13037 [Moritella sp. PE36]